MPDIAADIQYYKNANAFTPPNKTFSERLLPLLSRTECKYVNYPRVFRTQLNYASPFKDYFSSFWRQKACPS